MKIFFINNDGAGFADHIEVAPGTTAQQLFEQKMGQCASPDDYMLCVNRDPVVTRDQVLQEGNRVSITPTKVQVAA